jgi:hypothetical protein
VGTAVITIRATDTGGLTTDTAFNVTVAVRPRVTAAEFVYQFGSPQRVRFTFSEDVRASLSAADLSVARLGAGGGLVAVSEPTYDAATHTATFTFPAGILPNANYRATLAAAGVTNVVNVPMAADYVLDFFHLAGDFDRNRAVNTDDFIALASNFGRPNRTYAQGDADGNGTVDTSDFITLAANFGRTVPPPTAPAAASATVGTAPAPQQAMPGQRNTPRKAPPPPVKRKVRRAPRK